MWYLGLVVGGYGVLVVGKFGLLMFLLVLGGWFCGWW